MQHSRPLKFEEAPRIQWKSKGLVLICQKIGSTMELSVLGMSEWEK